MHKFNDIYRAKVLATDATENNKFGRIKVEIYPMLIGEITATRISKTDNVSIEGIAIADLPWATPAAALTIGAGVDIGTLAVPDVGTQVWVFFEAGDINQPVYLAAATTATLGLPPASFEIRAIDEDPDDPDKSHYPQRRVIRFNKVEIIIDDAVGDIIINVDRDIVNTIGQNVIINVGNNANITVENDATVLVKGAADIDVTGNADVDVGGQLDIDAVGNVNITGATVNINP